MTQIPVPVEIPVEIDDLTPNWFAAVLGGDVRGATVIESHSGTTGRARIALTHDEPELPPSVFVKFAPFSAAQRAFVDEQGMGVAEARFYAEIAPDVPVAKPAAFHAAWDDERRYVMVLEDLELSGAAPIESDRVDLSTVIDGVIDNFAALHGAFHGSPRFAAGADLAWVAKRSRGYGAGGPPFVTMAVDAFGDELGDGFREFADFYCRRAVDVASVIAEGTHTLVHGDAHMGNMFAIGVASGFYDWAVIGAAPGMRDVGYFLTNSVPTGLRRSEERRWLARYCDGLARRGVTLTTDDAWEQYRLQALTGWVAAVCTAGMGSKWQPIEVAVRSTKRSITAVADLDTIGAFAQRDVT